MAWIKVTDNLPPYKKPVLLFRGKNKHYTVAKLEEGTPVLKEWKKNCPEHQKKFWKSQSNNALRFYEQDYWYDFEPITITETFV